MSDLDYLDLSDEYDDEALHFFSRQFECGPSPFFKILISFELSIGDPVLVFLEILSNIFDDSWMIRELYCYFGRCFCLYV